MTIHWKKLYSAVDKRRKDRDVSWRTLAGEVNLTPSSFTRMSKGQSLSAANFIKVLRILDLSSAFDVYYK